MFSRIDAVLSQSVKSKGIAEKVATSQVFSTFMTVARTRLAVEALMDVKPIRITDGQLTVACRAASSAKALRQASAALVEGMAVAGAPIDGLRIMLAPWR